MLVSETEAAIANLLATHRYLVEQLQELTRIEKALQRPFQQIYARREQRITAAILEVSAMQLLRCDWEKCPSVKCSIASIHYQSNALSSEP